MLFRSPMVKGDRFMMCSDGLVDEIDDDAIAAILNAHDDPGAAAQALVDAANAHGGHDNTTVVVVDVLVGDDPETSGPVPVVDEDVPDRLIDADADSDVVTGVAAPTAVVQVSTMPDVQPRALGESAPRRRGLGMLLFGVALGLIVMLTVVLVLVVRNNADTPPATTSTSTTSTTSSTTSTSTTVAPDATAP